VKRRFQQVDVFGQGPISGNPLAVVVDSEGLETEEMEAITRWMNLSETAFLLPPSTDEADYRVRIFTLAGELPFAGHPTLGSCHVWLSSGGSPQRPGTVVQECGVGLIPIRRAERLAFAAPPLLRSGPVDPEYLNGVARALGVDDEEIVDSSWVDNGPGWVGLLLGDADRVMSLEPDFSRFETQTGLDIGVVGFYPEGSDPVYEVRAFFATDRAGMSEDPVTGSLNASVAQWMIETDRVTVPYVAGQGTCLRRTGRIHIDRDDLGSVWVGGATVTVIEGTIDV
jgi:PhzF family phenazine biosynthesis protein